MKNPKLIVKPFAKNGQKNVIPENYETSMESNQATWDQGFGQITMLPAAAGGLPPKGQDFNGIFNQISENIVYLSQGGRFKFSAEYAEAIGGYPKGSILQSDDEKKEYLSLIDNNKVDFNTATDISASWKLVSTDDLLSQIASKQPKGDYPTKSEMNAALTGKQDKSTLTSWRYLAKGGEETIKPPYDFTHCLTFLNGLEQYIDYSFAIEESALYFAEPLKKGDLVEVLINVPATNTRMASGDIQQQLDALELKVNSLSGKDFISSDVNNIVKPGSDDGVYLSEDEIPKIESIDVETKDH
ncbi:hypothetical protein AB7160_00555 [Morganella morganii]|uniref:hypothetical protein n=1 Tax=Morganella morganii TaxID=582 RepID=UPI0034E52E75